MQHEVVVRNNDAGSSYTIMMDMSEEAAMSIENLGVRLTEESDWSITLTVTQVSLA